MTLAQQHRCIGSELGWGIHRRQSHTQLRRTLIRSQARARSRSADRSRRGQSDSCRSAMSMLTFFINRGGRGLSGSRKQKLEKAKDKPRKLYRNRNS
ncbi:MAG: DUF3175 domain-containing protein [Pseudolabrys sp.]